MNNHITISEYKKQQFYETWKFLLKNNGALIENYNILVVVFCSKKHPQLTEGAATDKFLIFVN